MKPLPLLLTLVALAVVGAVVLTQLKPPTNDTENSALTSASPAPLPQDLDDPFPELPKAPLLEKEFVPDEQLISFVETHLQQKFSEPPVFKPVSAEIIISTIEQDITQFLGAKKLEELNTTARKLGFMPEFQLLEENLVTILAGEVRGFITPINNLVLNDFVITSPPEQAAIVNLLAQRLLSQSLPYPSQDATIDAILARHFSVQALAFSTEQEFRKTLPAYPASLNENIRESILLGLPAFFHELSTFSEFHLFKKLQTTSSEQTIKSLATPSPTPSRSLLSFPFKPEPRDKPSHLGAIPLYLVLLESTDPTTARTLATSLISDHTSFQKDLFSWTLEFASEKSPPRAAELFRSYFSLRDSEKKVRIEVKEQRLIIKVAS